MPNRKELIERLKWEFIAAPNQRVNQGLCEVSLDDMEEIISALSGPEPLPEGKMQIHCEGFNDDMAISSYANFDMSELSAKALSAASVGCLKEYIEQLESEQPASPWIPVSEDEPGDDDTYCVVINADRSLVGIGYWMGGELHCERQWWAHKDVDLKAVEYLPITLPAPPED